MNLTLGVLTRLRALFARTQSRPAPARHSHRRAARSAIVFGLLAFLAATVGMAAAVDTVKPEWRDPELALRLDQLRGWKAKAPQRPLVLAFGSSRTQMGLSPVAMNFPDEPGSPLVYNFGYRAGHPLGVWLNFHRARDAGVKPAAVLIQLAPTELVLQFPAERQLPATWFPRFTRADIDRLGPHTNNPAPFRTAWWKSRLAPWCTYREAVLSDLLPNWQTSLQRVSYSWEFTDESGFAPLPFAIIPDEVTTRIANELREKHKRAFTRFAASERTQALFREIVDTCRADGAPVAFFWAPESPSCEANYTPASRAAITAYSKQLGNEFGVPVFPAPTHLEEADFADGFHLMRTGAEKYSRWLAETHLKPWLRSREFRP